MGGVGVSRARRVRCGAVLLPSRLLPSSSAALSSVAGPSRRVCAVALSPSILSRMFCTAAVLASSGAYPC